MWSGKHRFNSFHELIKMCSKMKCDTIMKNEIRLVAPNYIFFKACDKNIISWFAMVYNFYPIRCLLSIPSLRKHNSSDKNQIPS